MMLAERGIYYRQQKFWFREIRRLTDSGHQTAHITTNFDHDATQIAAHMFARWSPENFFAYRMQHYGIDRFIDNQLQATDVAISVVNPAWQDLDNRIRSKNSQLSRRRQEFGALILSESIEERHVNVFVKKKVAWQDDIERLEKEIRIFKEKKKDIDRHIPPGHCETITDISRGY